MPHVIVVMLDGIGADYFAAHRANVPHLAALAEEGLLVERLSADVPGTSLPGRTSILTGAPASRHGIHGNLIWDGGRFRYANPDDVRMPTLPRLALDAGLDVAAIGFGMVRPEDATVFHHAWWAHEMLQRARDEAPIPADEGWLRTSRHRDASGRLAALAEAGLPREVPDAFEGDGMHRMLSEVTGDRTMLRWSAGLAASDAPPDLLLTEVLAPDTIQHAAGPDHPFSHWSIGYADALVGTLVEELRRARRLEDTALVVLSDHGHGPVERALYVERLLPGAPVACEGSILFVGVADAAQARDVEARLRPHEVERLDEAYLPEGLRSRLAAFVAPERTGFQPRPLSAAAEGLAADAVEGPPKYRSSHGFRPGHPSDERFAIVRGPGVGAASVARAAAEDVAPTIATLAGMPFSGAGRSLV